MSILLNCLRRLGLAWFIAIAATGQAWGTQPMQALQRLIAAAPAGATIQVPAEHFVGNLIVDKSVVLQGQAGSILDGDNRGDVIRVKSPKVVIAGLTIQNSGKNLTKMNAGIFAERTATDLVVRDNRFDNIAFGIWLDACRGPQILANRIHGAPGLRSQDRGNGVHLYNVYDGLVRDNEIWETRDGIYIDTSENNRLDSNYMHDLRYGVHYMYSYHNQVVNNLTRHTRTGYALMQSKYLTVTGNRSDADRNYGILMNYIVYSTIADNRISHTRTGQAFAIGGENVVGAEGKALFIYNSQFNDIHGNRLEDADIGIHLTAGSEDNHIYGNAFIGNRVQVKYVATRMQEWSRDGRGNYWSDYLGWDMNHDGVGDKPYEPNDAVDKLLWKYPMARILMSSPAINTLHWVQKQFPVLKPQGVQDSYPLMAVPVDKG